MALKTKKIWRHFMYYINGQTPTATPPPSFSDPVSENSASPKLIETAAKVSRPIGHLVSIALRERYTAEQIKQAPEQLFSLREEDARDEKEKVILILAGLLKQKEEEVYLYQGKLESETTQLKVVQEEAKEILEANLKQYGKVLQQKQAEVENLKRQLNLERTDIAQVKITLFACKKDLKKVEAKYDRNQKALAIVEANLKIEKAHREELNRELVNAMDQLKITNQHILELQEKLVAIERECDEAKLTEYTTRADFLETQILLSRSNQEKLDLLVLIKILKQKLAEKDLLVKVHAEGKPQIMSEAIPTKPNFNEKSPVQIILQENIGLKKENHNLTNQCEKNSQEINVLKEQIKTIYSIAKAIVVIAMTILIGSVLVWQYPEYIQKGWSLTKRYWINLNSFASNLFRPSNDRLNSLLFISRPNR